MPTIKILPDILANQIAAGEVVDRPASIVKELIENSLDAKASKITVRFKNGGKSSIMVEDNGYGMAPDDAILCFERHATSKIHKVQDLNAIHTFGFRGEAIPSIASVSRFTLKTRTELQASGTEILISGGKLVYQKDVGMPVGTTIEVANLFNTIPARRKFLKTENTESAHIVHTVRLYALSFPEVSFTLFENDRLVFKTNASRNLLDRISEVWTTKVSKDLLPLEAREGELKLTGLIGSPTLYRSTRHELLTFVNNRPVDTKTLYYAFTESYHTYIPKGRFPVVFAFLEIPPQLIDVNVHPSKREIKFRQEPLVRQFVVQSVLDALAPKKTSAPAFDLDALEKSFTDKRLEKTPAPVVFPASVGSPMPIARPNGKETRKVEDRPLAPMPTLADLVEATASTKPPIKTPRPLPAINTQDWRVLNILQNGYALLESSSGIIVFNYRGAHHRVCYEKLLKEFYEQAPISQPLLIPIPMEVTNLENDALMKGRRIFEKLGFTLVPFGRNYYRIESVNTLFQNTDPYQLVKNIINLLQEETGDPLKQVFVQKIVQLSSFQAITTTSIPDGTVILDLVEQLMQCENPLTCPRGFPIYSETTYSELDRKFGR